MTEPIHFTLDGAEVEAAPGETIWQVANRQGVEIPHLCWLPKPGYRADGNCRACMVEIEGERVLAASCVRKAAPGMKVQTASERARFSRQMVFELLVGDQPSRAAAHDPNSRFWQWADTLGVAESRFPRHPPPAPGGSHPAMAVQLDACIQCNLCVRACREVQVNDVIGMAARGYHEKIIFDFDDPMGNSTCVACGECVQACPTGALMPATLVDANGVYTNAPEREVDSVCPYCGVGCQLTYKIRDDRIVAVDGRDGPANHNRLCVKGRFGFDYAHHPDRPTENHPVAATFFKQAAKRGVKIIVIDPRGYTLMRHAWKTLRFNPGRDVALLNALIHTIIEEGLYDRQYVQAHTEDFEKLREHIRDYSPEKMASICGVDAATLREVARTYARV